MQVVPTVVEYRITVVVDFLWVVQGQGAKLPV
jgi:hypothetical protein